VPVASVDDLSVAFRENDVVKVVQLDKMVLAQSPTWVTIAFLAADVDAAGQQGTPRVVLRRYRRQGGRFQLDKHFTLTTPAQGAALGKAMAQWLQSSWVAQAGPTTDDA
jgi:hypothetical protein